MAKGARDFLAKYGPWALVAGASEGLGAEFARQIAQKGLNLVIVARRAKVLEEQRSRLENGFGVQVRSVPVDLASPELMAVLNERTADVEIGLLVYNAGLSMIGPFMDQPLDQHMRTIAVNCRGPVLLAYSFGRKMRERGRGGIILMSSMAGFQGSALVAHYAATKAFGRVLAEGLWEELRGSGVDVLACCAGATRTPGYIASRPADTGILSAPVTEPDQVADEALTSLGKRSSCIPGLSNRLASFFMQRLLPRSLAIGTISRTTRAMYNEKKSKIDQ